MRRVDCVVLGLGAQHTASTLLRSNLLLALVDFALSQPA